MPVPLMLPAKLVLLFAPPRVSVAEPSVTLPPVLPPPASEPMLLLKLARSSVAPLTFARLTAEFEPNARVLPALSVPPLNVVAPV